MEAASLVTTLLRWLPLLGGLVAAGALYLSIRTYVRYRGNRLVTCPRNGRCAAVEVDAAHAALTTALAWPELRIASCSGWPEMQRCGQPCLEQVAAAPEDCLVSTIASQWYKDKTCVYCGKAFVDGERREPKPARVEPDGRRVEWCELTAEKAHAALAMHPYVCWNCHIIETSRQQQREQARPAGA